MSRPLPHSFAGQVRGVLEGATVVPVGLPSESDAVEMLLTASGLKSWTEVPAGAREVVQFCNR